MKKEKDIVRFSPEGERRSRTNWKNFSEMTDEEIRRAISDDPDAAPELDESWFENAQIVTPGKQAVSLRVDRDVLDFFKSQGSRYQTRMNAVLKAYVDHERHQVRSAGMTKHYPKGLDGRMRDQDGEIRKKRSDTLVGTLRLEYGEHFAKGYRSDTKLGTVLKKEGVETLDQLLKRR
jgi:uncharacterized protein (DUF4415 family)